MSNLAKRLIGWIGLALIWAFICFINSDVAIITFAVLIVIGTIILIGLAAGEFDK